MNGWTAGRTVVMQPTVSASELNGAQIGPYRQVIILYMTKFLYIAKPSTSLQER
jgi:hypothetical protein